MERRRVFAQKYNINKLDYATVDNPFAGRFICGYCGSTFGRKVWNSNNEKLRRIEKMTIFESKRIIVTLLDRTEIEVVVE